MRVHAVRACVHARDSSAFVVVVVIVILRYFATFLLRDDGNSNNNSGNSSDDSQHRARQRDVAMDRFRVFIQNNEKLPQRVLNSSSAVAAGGGGGGGGAHAEKGDDLTIFFALPCVVVALRPAGPMTRCHHEPAVGWVRT
jgi:hypothetical protein